MDITHVTWLVPPVILLAGLGLSAGVATLLAPLVVSGGPVDVPRDRGAHKIPTPTSGGLAIMAACAFVTAALLIFCGKSIPGGGRDGLMLLGFASLMGLTGAIDDLIDMPARFRFGFQIVLCLIFAWFYRVDTLDFGPGLVVHVWPPFSMLGTTAWLLLGINAVNFMDGSNGLALGAQTLALLISAALIALMASATPLGGYMGATLVICVCAAGAHLGFLPFNLPPNRPSLSKAFEGDAGSLFGGALITGVTLIMKAYGVGSVWFGGFILTPLLVDVVLTLFTRMSQRKDVFKPHKEHLYQLWLLHRDPSHGRLALRVWALCALSSAIGLSARAIDDMYHADIRFPVLVLTVAIYSLLWFRLRKKLLSLPLVNAAP